MPLTYITKGETTMFTASKENNDSFVTIRFSGRYIALRNCFKEARDTINFDHWNSVELGRIESAKAKRKTVNEIWK